MERPIPKTPLPTPRFFRGPELVPPAALRRWLVWHATATTGPRPVRLPVQVTLAPHAIASITLGVAAVAGPPVAVQDAALGVSLRDRAVQHAHGGATCTLWLDGTWQEADGGALAVVAVHPLATHERAQATFAAVAWNQPHEITLADHIDALAQSEPAQREPAAAALLAAGVVAVPVLISALDDARASGTRDAVNRHGLPGFLPPPPPRLVTVPVGARCHELLHRIVTPPASCAVTFRGKVFSTQVLRIRDWYAWWAAHQHQTLAQIHHDLIPLVDAYWQQHGTTQEVP